ncbi:MAG: hypothetical protein ACO1OF_08135 [Adhaeribacter sp.]
MRVKITLVLFFVLGQYVVSAAGLPDLVQYVNTLQGTNSKHELTRGNTYPTTALPFAMHTWTPQTGRNGNGWKYQFFADSIRGFQQAHQCSSWTNDYAVFSLMPVTGGLVVDQFKRAARFSHQNEIAKPHYYKVRLDNGITTELSPTERGVHARFSFPKNKKGAYLVLDGYTGASMVKIIQFRASYPPVLVEYRRQHGENYTQRAENYWLCTQWAGTAKEF